MVATHRSLGDLEKKCLNGMSFAANFQDAKKSGVLKFTI